MFEEYLYEIIAAIVIVVLVAISLIIKSNPSNANQEKEDIEKEILIQELDKKSQQLEELNIETQEDTPSPQNTHDDFDTDFSGSEEGDFGEETIFQEAAVETKAIHKRQVPSHDKITKHNFTEFSGQRILVAEDNLINQKVLTGLLAGSGIDVTLADDGQEALDILEKDTDFLMVLMDAHMPRVDGFEATRAIRKDPKYDHILVVALSGDTASDDIAKMKNAGMAEQLEKPLRMEALYDIFYAYTGDEQKEAEDEDLVEVIMTKELNGDKGLEVCGGDEGFYREILTEFIKDYQDSAQKLKESLQTADMRGADRLLLDVIGVTANIGADNLHNIANEIKASLSDAEDESYLTDQYQKHLTALIKDIKKYL